MYGTKSLKDENICHRKWEYSWDGESLRVSMMIYND
jgi:hypothetical protein